MGLLPGGEKLGLLPSSISNGGEKKPPLLSHKLTGAEITAVRQLITGYRCRPENISLLSSQLFVGEMLQNRYLMLLNQGIGGLLAEVCGRTGTPAPDPAQALDVETTSLYLVSFPD